MSEDSAVTPSWAEVILRAMDSRLCELHVALPGRVETYNPATQTADVKPMIRSTVRRDGTDELIVEELPVIPSVPVLFPRAGSFFVSLPVKPGHFGMLVFNERSIDRFRALGADEPPGDNRCHALAGATFLPCALTPSSAKLADAHADNLVVGRDGGSAIHIRPDDEIHLGSDGAAEKVVTEATLKTELKTLMTAAAAAAVPGDGGKVAFQSVETALGIPATSLGGSEVVKGDV